MPWRTGIIISGASKKPVYLFIDDDRVEIRDAHAVWGKGTRETERLIKRELGGDESKISVACIGQAGEARLHGAIIKNIAIMVPERVARVRSWGARI